MNISDVILILFVFIMLLTPYILFLLLQRLPDKRRQALDQFAKYAVQKVEQQYSHMSSAQKRAYAETVIEHCFTAARLPIPDYILIDAAIESFTYELRQVTGPQEPPELEPAALKTGPLPIPPKEPQGA